MFFFCILVYHRSVKEQYYQKIYGCNFLINSLFIFQKLEGRVASDEDLKLSDTLRYYMRDSNAAKNLLYRRLRALATYENCNKALDKARSKNKDVAQVRDRIERGLTM